MNEPDPEHELADAFGHALGFLLAAIGCLVGGGILVILIAAILFRLLYGG